MGGKTATQLYTEYKFGVLYYKDGQTNEDDMFGNVDTSPEYEAFLQMLGQKVRLQGWKQYAAGLDTEKNQTGTHSIFTTWDKCASSSFLGLPACCRAIKCSHALSDGDRSVTRSCST